jgi:hypothetical protein
MEDLLVVALAGFAAALVDGALGMGFGPTSSSILLASGLPPAAVSTTVNLAKVASGAVGGLAHWKFGNVDRRLALLLAVPGALGALIGTTLLAQVDGDALRPWLAVLLVLVALRMLLRFGRPVAVSGGGADGRPHGNEVGVTVVAAAGGVTNGLVGAWGPVVTPFLLHRGMQPRYAVGSVNMAEIAVAATAAGSLLGAVGGGGIDPATVAAMLGGGVIGAPVAAFVVRHLPARVMGLGVAGLLLVANLGSLPGLPSVSGWAVAAAVAVLVALAAAAPRVLATSAAGDAA